MRDRELRINIDGARDLLELLYDGIFQFAGSLRSFDRGYFDDDLCDAGVGRRDLSGGIGCKRHPVIHKVFETLGRPI